MSRLWTDRRIAYALVIAACALPRLAVLLYERAAILTNFEKSRILRAAVPEDRDLRLRARASVGLHPAALRLLPDRRLLDRRLPLVVGRDRAAPDRGRDLALRASRSAAGFSRRGSASSRP